jgi:hypothetical protein
MFDRTIGTKGQGNVGVAAAILYFAKQGNIISIPLNDSQEYDLVVDIDGKLNKVQVKTTKYSTEHGVYQASLVSSGGSKREVYHRVCESQCDLLFVLCENNTQYLIPRDIFKNNIKSINLGKNVEQFIVI